MKLKEDSKTMDTATWMEAVEAVGPARSSQSQEQPPAGSRAVRRLGKGGRPVAEDPPDTAALVPSHYREAVVYSK